MVRGKEGRWLDRLVEQRPRHGGRNQEPCTDRTDLAAHGSSRGSTKGADLTRGWSSRMGSDQGWPERCIRMAIGERHEAARVLGVSIAVVTPIRSTTRSETPSSGCTRSPDEISTNGFSTSSWPETNFPAKTAAAAAAHGGVIERGEGREAAVCY
ncbi:hypothetical protein F511_32648 [Dorcoceras hygrometricum]|uniref:Uncharacterized protein n=1 Tax=Dorcoceras hygrometricum TaxID=472368 RepID=A0A2Z7B818_9LAMI|nr:hypothetical protein F511_32648 [Dorcoceras hygrometricum]